MEPVSKDAEVTDEERAQHLKDAMDSAVSGTNRENGNFSVDTMGRVVVEWVGVGTVFRPDSLRDEQTATLVVSDSSGCGITFGFKVEDAYTLLEFKVDGELRFYRDYRIDITYQEYLPCGAHTYKWTWTRKKIDGLPSSSVYNIKSLRSRETSYAGDWSFENGWPSDLDPKGWVVNNMYAHQGEFSIWGGYMRDEESKELRIIVPDSVTKMNFYYQFADASSSYSGPQDTLTLHAANDAVIMERASMTPWPYSDYYNAKKYSRLMMPGDSVIVVRLYKAEDAFAQMMVDDIRFTSEVPHAQADAEWDFEDDFYPVEVSPTWVVDNGRAYEGEYSLRTRAGAQYNPEFSLAVAGVDSLSFWGYCEYGAYAYNNFRIVVSGDTTQFACSNSWKKFELAIEGADTVRFIAGYDKDKPLERRVDLIKVW